MKVAALKVEIGHTTEALREKELVIETMGASGALERGATTVGAEPPADSRQSVDNRQSVGSQVFSVFVVCIGAEGDGLVWCGVGLRPGYNRDF